jgi:hypothetical protein
VEVGDVWRTKDRKAAAGVEAVIVIGFVAAAVGPGFEGCWDFHLDFVDVAVRAVKKWDRAQSYFHRFP